MEEDAGHPTGRRPALGRPDPAEHELQDGRRGIARRGSGSSTRRRVGEGLRVVLTGLAVVLFPALLFFVGYVLWCALAPPPLPEPTAKPVRQPGGLMRQIAAPEGLLDMDWPEDGSRIAFVFAETGRLRSFVRRFSTLQDPCYVAVVNPQTGSHRMYHLPNGASPLSVLWRPRTSVIAVSGSEYRRTDCRLLLRAWLLNASTGALSPPVSSDPSEALSWSPDGRTLLCERKPTQASPSQYYRLLDMSDGRIVNVAHAQRFQELGEHRWSPDSRTLAFLWTPGRRWEDENPGRGLWLVDAQTGKAQLLRLGACRGFVWLADGRRLFWCSSTKSKAKVVTRFGILANDRTRIEWLPRTVPGLCRGIHSAQGRFIVCLSNPQKHQAHWSNDICELSLPECRLRRLMSLPRDAGWGVLPPGTRIAVGVWADDSLSRGIWVLDIEPEGARARVRQGDTAPAVN